MDMIVTRSRCRQHLLTCGWESETFVVTSCSALRQTAISRKAMVHSLVRFAIGLRVVAVGIAFLSPRLFVTASNSDDGGGLRKLTNSPSPVIVPAISGRLSGAVLYAGLVQYSYRRDCVAVHADELAKAPLQSATDSVTLFFGSREFPQVITRILYAPTKYVIILI